MSNLKREFCGGVYVDPRAVNPVKKIPIPSPLAKLTPEELSKETAFISKMLARIDQEIQVGILSVEDADLARRAIMRGPE